MGLLGWWIPSKTWPLRHNLGNFDLLFQNEIIHKAKAPILFLGGFLFSVYHPLPCLICLASLVSNRPKTLTTISLDPYKARIKAWWTNTGPWKLTIQLIYVNDLQHSNEILKFKLRRHYSTWEKRIINPQDPTHRPCHTVGSEQDSLPPKRSNIQVQNRPTLPLALSQKAVTFYFLSGFVSYRLPSTTVSTSWQNRVRDLRAWREKEKNKNPKPNMTLAKEWRKWKWYHLSLNVGKPHT